MQQDLESDFRPLDSRTAMKNMSSLQPLRLWKSVIKAFENCYWHWDQCGLWALLNVFVQKTNTNGIACTQLLQERMLWPLPSERGAGILFRVIERKNCSQKYCTETRTQMKLHLSFDGTASLKFQASGMEEKPFFMEDHSSDSCTWERFLTFYRFLIFPFVFFCSFQSKQDRLH